MGNRNSTREGRKRPRLRLLAGAAACAGVLTAAAFLMPYATQKNKPEPEIITVSTLEKIIHVSELSTFTAVYNGIAQVRNEADPEKTDYYVSYEARVNAGIDFEAIGISVDQENKQIHIRIPKAYITDINVDISSLDFIFCNRKANTSAVTQEAFKACEEDAERESRQQAAIFELAQQNAKNILAALTRPIVQQLDPEYTVVIE